VPDLGKGESVALAIGTEAYLNNVWRVLLNDVRFLVETVAEPVKAGSKPIVMWDNATSSAFDLPSGAHENTDDRRDSDSNNEKKVGLKVASAPATPSPMFCVIALAVALVA